MHHVSAKFLLWIGHYFSLAKWRTSFTSTRKSLVSGCFSNRMTNSLLYLQLTECICHLQMDAVIGCWTMQAKFYFTSATQFQIWIPDSEQLLSTLIPCFEYHQMKGDLISHWMFQTCEDRIFLKGNSRTIADTGLRVISGSSFEGFGWAGQEMFTYNLVLTTKIYFTQKKLVQYLLSPNRLGSV